jgi:hypothetical protein
MENENLLNNILLIVLLLLAANYLSGGSVLEVLKRYYEKILNYFNNKIEGLQNTDFKGRIFEGIKQCSKTTPPIVHDTDFKQIYQKNYNLKDDPNMRKLYHFLQSIITVNNNHYELVSSKNKVVSMSQNDKESLTKFINKSFNCGDFRFENVVILDSLVYFENSAGKELRPFRASGDVYINKEPIGKVTLHLEMFIRSDSTFYGPFNSGFPTFTRIKLIRKDKIATPINDLPNNNDYEEIIASENSLIPDSINFSTEESGTGYSESE